MNSTTQDRIGLDWSRLLGFDQVKPVDGPSSLRLKDARLAKVGGKRCLTGVKLS